MLSLLNYMVQLYGVETHDWLNFRITKDNCLTFHHLVKEENGGKKVIENGAILTRLSHAYLHEIERIDKEIFLRINTYLKKINERGTSLSREDQKIIDSLFKEFELKHDKELRLKIKKQCYNPQVIRQISYRKDFLSPTNIRLVMQEGIDPIGFPVKRRKKAK